MKAIPACYCTYGCEHLHHATRVKTTEQISMPGSEFEASVAQHAKSGTDSPVWWLERPLTRALQVCAALHATIGNLQTIHSLDHGDADMARALIDLPHDTRHDDSNDGKMTGAQQRTR